MKKEYIRLSQIKLNENNPRTISEGKFNKLINSLLILPKMLELRPIVVSETMVALGGNMRLRALQTIKDMPFESITERLNEQKDFKKKTQAEQELLLGYWQQWQQTPIVPIVRANELTEEEQKEFIIKDNVGFGAWDWDRLANEWDTNKLEDWGLDVWLPEKNNSDFGGFNDNPNNDNPNNGVPNDSNYPTYVNTDNDGTSGEIGTVPPETEGDEQTLMERVIIVYPKERMQDVAQLLGLETIEKVVYNISEIIQ